MSKPFNWTKVEGVVFLPEQPVEVYDHKCGYRLIKTFEHFTDLKGTWTLYAPDKKEVIASRRSTHRDIETLPRQWATKEIKGYEAQNLEMIIKRTNENL